MPPENRMISSGLKVDPFVWEVEISPDGGRISERKKFERVLVVGQKVQRLDQGGYNSDR